MYFWKMQGVGNDFVVLDATAMPPDTDWAQLSIWLCERRFGIGSDGLLTVARDTHGTAFVMRMFNPDGTEDMCGNGLRCVGLWAYRAGWLGGTTEFTAATKDGPRRCRLADVSQDGLSGSLSVGMGSPRFAPPEIPFCAPNLARVVDFPLSVADKTFAITSVNTGSTHTVIFGEAPDNDTFQRCSPLIENHPLFPERTSILWATQSGPNRFAIRIWERGAGETLGCGTGACAVGVAARLRGLVNGTEPTEVVSKGGTLSIGWPGDTAEVQMRGPARFVFDGQILI